jgi:hypothetical protein
MKGSGVVVGCVGLRGWDKAFGEVTFKALTLGTFRCNGVF